MRRVRGSQDLENTVGSWDLYGVEDSKRYPSLQAEFFERAAAPLTRRSAVTSFLALSTLPPPRHAANVFAATVPMPSARVRVAVP